MAWNLRDIFEEKISDINPFDGGKTGATVRAQRAKPAPAQTVSRQSIPVAQAQTRNVSIQNAPQRNISVQQAPQRRISVAPAQRIRPQVRVVSAPMPKPAPIKKDWGKLAKDSLWDENPVVDGAVETVRALARSPEQMLRSVAGLPFQEKDQDLLTSNKIAGIPGTEGVAKFVYGQPIKTYQQQAKDVRQSAEKSDNATIRKIAPAAHLLAPLLAGADATGLSGVSAGTSAAAKVAAPAVREASKQTVKVAKDVNRAVEQVNPRVKEIDEFEMPRLKQAWDVETNPVRRVQISRGIQQLNAERQSMAQGGYIKTPGDDLPNTQEAPITSLTQKADQALNQGPTGSSPKAYPETLTPKASMRSVPIADDLPQGGLSQNLTMPKDTLLVEQLAQASKKPAKISVQSPSQQPPIASDVQKPSTEQIQPELSQKMQELAPTKGAQVGKIENQQLSSVGKSIQEITPKVKGTEKKVPVRLLSRDGDVVTSTNVNPKVKANEKRYSVDNDGELIPDKKGATSLFTDDDGKVKGFRVGDEYFNAKALGDLSSVNGYGSILATSRRNIERAFDKRTGDKVNEFLVDHQQAQATKLVERQIQLRQEMQSIADDLGINFKLRRFKAKRVSAAIQDLGEKQRTFADIEAEFGTDMAHKIANADNWFRTNYDSLLDEMNTTLTKFGYEPVPKRDNYYTHFQDEGLWKNFGLKMQEIRDLASPTMQDANPGNVRGSVSNKLAGLTEQTKPNKAFNPFALERKGDKHTSNAFEAFERYLNPTLNNIYMTPSITRARVIARAVAQEADVAGKDANKTIIQIREWANNLAGKSNRFDRPIIDTAVGDKALRVAGWAQRKAGENTIVGNLATAFLQPIVLAQSTGKFGVKNVLLGAMQQLPGASNKAQAKSSFLIRRYTDNMKVTATALDKTKEVANTPLREIEEESTRITWNAAHNEALSKGLGGDKAVHYADVQTEKTVAGRSIGERPEAFRSKAAGPFTMYQLEVSNFWQQMTKEMTKAQAARTLVAAYGINLALQEIIGRDVGFNPIDAAIDTYDETKKIDKPNEDKAKAVGQRWAGEFVDNVPFVGQAATTLFGEKNVKKVTGNDSNTGRFGVSSPLRTLVDNPWMMVSPVAGGQIKKTIEGTKTVMDGALRDKDGKTIVNVPQTPMNYAKGALFGKGAIPEVNQYYENIGKKKVDQKQVDNQTDSKAFRMGKTDVKTVKTKAPKKPDTGWTDEYHALKKQFAEQSKDWSPVKRALKEKDLAELENKRHFSKDVTSLYSRSKADVFAFVSKDPNGKKYFDDILRYGDKMVAAGLWKYNKYRDKNGNVQYVRGYTGGTKTAKSSSGRKSSGRKSTGRKTASRGGRKSAKGKYSYKFDEFSKVASTNSKSLRDLLKKAQMRSKTA